MSLVRVEVLVASCCTPLDVQKKIVSILQDMQGQVPDLDWNVLDITKEPELAVTYKAPMTPAMAPLAPTVGTGEERLKTICRTPAASPLSR